MDNSNTGYLDEKVVNKSRRNGIIMLAIGGPLFIMFVLTYAYMMFEIFSVSRIDLNEIMGAITFIMIVIMIVAPFFLLARGGLRRIILTSRAAKLNAFFVNDDDGIIPLDEIAAKLKMRRDSIADQVGEMLKRKYLHHVRILESDPACVLLTDGVKEKWHDACYLNESVLFDEKVNTGFVTWTLGMFCTSITVFMPAFIMINLEERFPLFILIIPITLFSLLYWGFFTMNRNRRRLKRASAYNQAMESCQQSAMPVTEIAEKVKVSEEKAVEDIRGLLESDVLKGCSLDLGHEPSVTLADVRRGSAVFTAVNCPHCGSTARIRTGRAGKCSYCGNFLTAPADTAASIEAVRRNDSMRTYRRWLPESGQYDFLNQENRKKAKERASLFLMAGGFILLITASMTFTMAAYGISEGVGTLVRSAIFIAVGGFGGWKLFHEGILLLDANRYAMTAAKLFCITPYRELRAADIAAITGAGAKGTDLLKRTFRYGFMQNCKWNDGTVVLQDRAHAKSAYVRSDCPHCGAEMMLKKGVVTVCSWCGSFVDENGVMHAVGTRNKKVILDDTGENKGGVIAYVNDLTGLSGVQMEDLVSSLPAEIARTDESGAAAIRDSLQALGASVTIS
ncbi:MAG: ribosomal protein L7/L12 [Solobacterium sp.]|nr:ribosomal protein L7/L12 [Solobacterium sp.]